MNAHAPKHHLTGWLFSASDFRRAWIAITDDRNKHVIMTAEVQSNDDQVFARFASADMHSYMPHIRDLMTTHRYTVRFFALHAHPERGESRLLGYIMQLCPPAHFNAPPMFYGLRLQ